jgi:hypothetical protein
MKRYIGAGIVLVIVAAYSYHQHSECKAAGGVLLRGAFELVCVRNLEIIR